MYPLGTWFVSGICVWLPWIKETMIYNNNNNNNNNNNLLTPWSNVLDKLTVPQLAKYPPHFMEPEGSLPHLQQLANCPYPQPDQSSSWPPSHFLKIHLNTILPSMPGSSKWYLPLRFPHQNTVYTYSLLLPCYTPRQSHSFRFYRPNNIWWVQITKLLVT